VASDSAILKIAADTSFCQLLLHIGLFVAAFSVIRDHCSISLLPQQQLQLSRHICFIISSPSSKNQAASNNVARLLLLLLGSQQQQEGRQCVAAGSTGFLLAGC
jgi:hypothetical protein